MSNSLASNTILRNYSSSPTGSLKPGMSTEECMVNGAMLAITSCIEQILNNLYEEHGRKFICIMTGGASDRIREYLNFEIHYEQYLLFTGMKLVAGE
jgi:pantothenate kinase type III